MKVGIFKISDLWIGISALMLVLLLIYMARIGTTPSNINPGLYLSSKADLSEISTSLEKHKEETGMLPASLDQLEANYVDAWGNLYNYQVDSKGLYYEVYSSGPDGIENTRDDIRN